MLKDKKIDIAETNMALFGTPLEREIKQRAAQGEPAWKEAGKAPGIQVWRVEKFEIKEWPKNKYGYFFDGDSYIVLHTYLKEDKKLYNVHFWLGQYTSQDEAGTAAYKTVELDDYLGDLPVQYREVQGFESTQFLSLFPKLIIQSGGVDSGFTHVEAEKYRTRLLHIKGTIKNILVREAPLSSTSLNSGDVFLLDKGLKLYQWQGKGASGGEKSKAGQIAQAIDDERGGKPEKIVLEESDEASASGKETEDWAAFWAALGGKGPVKATDDAPANIKVDKKAFKVSDATGSVQFSEVPYKRSSLQEDDVFVVFTGASIFTWVGSRASANERKQAMVFAQKFLNSLPPEVPRTISIVRVLSGAENDEFFGYF